MFSIQSFLGRDPKFFDLLEASAHENCNCSKAVREILTTADSHATLHSIRQARHNSKRITEEIRELALKTFVTVLDREDIEALAEALYRIPKPLEKFAERLMISRDVLTNHRPFEQLDLIEECIRVVVAMVKTLRKGIDAEQVSKYNNQLQTREAEADKLELELLKQLYHSTNPIQAIVARDLYALLEKVVDRCRDAGNVVLMICHKNS